MEVQDLPDFIKQQSQTWKDLNPEYKYHFYTDPQRRNFIAKYYPQEVIDTYDMLIPGAFRADLWRYCLLYVKGGVYADIGTACIQPLKNILPNVQFIAARDRDNESVYNCFIASSPRHPFLREAIKQIVIRVHKNYYGDCPLEITGPKLLGQSVNKVLGRECDASFDIGLHSINDYTFYLYPHDPVGTIEGILTKDYGEQYQEYKKTHGSPYDLLWRERRLYRATPPVSFEIPKYIFQTMKDENLSPGMVKAKQSWIEKNPEYEHFFYTDEDCRDFIGAHFEERVLQAFDKLIPGAFRADLWRYCVLYVKGGVYADIATVCQVPLRDLIPNVHFVSVRDRAPADIFNCFMASIRGHPFLKRAIDQAVENIHNNYYGSGSLDITGPRLLGMCINRVLGKKDTNHFNLGRQSTNGIDFILYEHSQKGGEIKSGDKCIIKTRYSDDYHTDLHKRIGGKGQKYGELWEKRQVYRY
jgi:mannosyltransferase OCH1-like enzyme